MPHFRTRPGSRLFKRALQTALPTSCRVVKMPYFRCVYISRSARTTKMTQLMMQRPAPFLHMKGLHYVIMWLTCKVLTLASSPSFSTSNQTSPVVALLEANPCVGSINSSNDWTSCATDLKELAVMVDVVAYSYACSLRREMPNRTSKRQ
jgi:hypothetical protein